MDQQLPAKAGPGKTDERGGVQAVTGADLGEKYLVQHSAEQRRRSASTSYLCEVQEEAAGEDTNTKQMRGNSWKRQSRSILE